MAPIGAVAGMTTMLVTPAKLAVMPTARGTPRSCCVMPVWLMREPLNLAPLRTGSTGTLEPVPRGTLARGR